jgi:hypothetical protein
MKAFLALFGMLCAALLVVACAPAPAGTSQTPTTDTTPEPTTPTVVPEAPSEPVTGGNELDPSTLDALPKDVQDILAKGETQNAKGYGYFLSKQLPSGSIAGDFANNIHVTQKGDVRKATLNEEYQLDKDYFVYFVITDENTQQATAYCERRSCGGIPDAAPRAITYSEWSWMAPHEWLDGLSDVEKLGEEDVADRNAFKLSGERDDKPILIWVDRFSGLPLRVEYDGFTYLYTKLTLGASEQALQP